MAEKAGLALPKDWQTLYVPEFRYSDQRRTIGNTIDAQVKEGMIIIALRRDPNRRYNWVKKRWEYKQNPYALTRQGRKRRRGRKGRTMRDMLAAMAGELFSIPWKDRGRRGR
jgi:hypothetical protein